MVRLEGVDSADANVVLVWDPNHMIPAKQKYLDFFEVTYPEPI